MRQKALCSEQFLRDRVTSYWFGRGRFPAKSSLAQVQVKWLTAGPGRTRRVEEVGVGQARDRYQDHAFSDLESEFHQLPNVKEGCSQ